MILAMVGDYLLGFGTFGMSSDPSVYMGITANVVPDWRYTITNLPPENEDNVDTWIACTVREKGDGDVVMDQYIHAGTGVTVNLTEGMTLNVRSSKSQMSISCNEKPSWAP